MKNPTTAKKANAEALDTDNETIAQTGESAITKVTNQPNQDSIELDFEALQLDMETNIQSCPDQFVADGTIHRFDVDAVGDMKGWYAFHSTEDISYAFYGDWGEGETYRWHSLEDTVVTPAQSQMLKSAKSEAQIARNEARAIEQSEAANKCKKLWDNFDDASDSHPYLRKKGIKPYGIKQNSYCNHLFIPVLSNGNISSLQEIDETGRKTFFTNGKVSGSYHLIGSFGPLVLMCEGYATGASLHEATRGNF
jgi:putative DNA primase/helicase